MRLHRLEVEGFGPFLDRQIVDFDAYADDGIFLIAGRTGAGKSSILDGVCFALFGGVPRYGTGEKRLRSDHCEPDDPTEVSLEFTVAGRRLRVTRQPQYERAKRRGVGMTPIAARATLDELIDGSWTGLAARPVDVGRELHEIVRLTQEQFLQVVLLAQNRFAEFLLAPVDRRREVLQTLFGTRRYEEYAAALDERRKTSEAAVGARSEGVKRLLDEVLRGDEVVPAAEDVDAAFEAAALVVARAGYRVESSAVSRDAADTAFRAAEAAHRDAVARAERLAARDRSRAALDALEKRGADVDTDRTRLARATDAEELRAALDAADRATAAVSVAAAAEAAARDALTESSHAEDAASLVDHIADPAEDLASLADDLAGSLAVWRAALDREDELAEVEAEHAAVGERLRELISADADLARQRAGVPSRVAVLERRLAEDRGTAGGADAAAAAVTMLEARLEASEHAARLAPMRDAADAALVAALADSDSASAALTRLLRRRLSGHAAELAAGLVDGDPCAVCGSTTHPLPATSDDDPVTDEDLAAAERRKELAGTAESDAVAAARTAREAYTRAAERSGGVAASDIAVELADAVARRDATAAAAARVIADEAGRSGLLALAEEIDREREAAAIDVVAARDALTRLDERRATGLAALADARGTFPTVGLRIAAAEERLRALRGLLDAVAESGRCSAASLATTAALDAAVTASPFADPAEARGALVERDARTALAEAVAAHDTAVRLERERLLALELEVADTPEEQIDPAAAAQRRAEARDAWIDAIGAATRAAQDAERLAGLLDRATASHVEIAELARDAEVVARLANTVAGRAPNMRRMDLETFVLAAELEEIVAAANLRLADMSSGRFQLVHSDALAARGAASGLGLDIVDGFTGTSRPTASLSGGQKFYASLALALGLAEVVTARAGGMRLDTLFVDEGFGSLDDDVLELAMDTLDELRQGGRTVGIISHLAGVKERVSAQLRVEALPGGPSVIRQDLAASV